MISTKLLDLKYFKNGKAKSALIKCNYCKIKKWVIYAKIKDNKGKYCSRRCYELDMVNRIGLNSNNYKGGVVEKTYRYIRIGKRYFREHRLIMEAYIKRKLRSSEYVHHINENGLDNRVENLLLLSPSEHMKLHLKTTFKIDKKTGRFLKKQ
jgi:hypothetical protein